MKYLFSGHNNPANSAVLVPSEYCARRVGSRNNYLLKKILLDILGTIVVGFSKLGNTFPLRARVHILNIIDNIVNVLLWPAHFNTCRGSGERDISGTSSDRECPVHEFLVMLLNKFCCIFSNEQVRCNAFICSHDETIGGWIISSSSSYLSPPSSASSTD